MRAAGNGGWQKLGVGSKKRSAEKTNRVEKVGAVNFREERGNGRFSFSSEEASEEARGGSD